MLLAVGLLAGCPGPHLMPTPNVYVQTQAPFADVAPPLRTNTVDVLYATDRQPVPRDDGTLAYGYGRSFSMAVGSCVVEIGQDVAWDTLVQQSQQAERTQELPLRIRALTEQVSFPPPRCPSCCTTACPRWPRPSRRCTSRPRRRCARTSASAWR